MVTGDALIVPCVSGVKELHLDERDAVDCDGLSTAIIEGIERLDDFVGFTSFRQSDTVNRTRCHEHPATGLRCKKVLSEFVVELGRLISSFRQIALCGMYCVVRLSFRPSYPTPIGHSGGLRSIHDLAFGVLA